MPCNYNNYRSFPSSCGAAGASGSHIPSQESHGIVALLKQLVEIKKDRTVSLFDDRGHLYRQLLSVDIRSISRYIDLSSYVNVVSQGLLELWAAQKNPRACEGKQALQAYPDLIDRAQQALSAIADHYVEHKQDWFNRLDARGGALLCNGFSKQPEDASCKKACQAIAIKIAKEPLFTRDVGVSPIWSQYANAFSKWHDDPVCRQALMHIALKVVRYINQDNDFKDQHCANLANAFCKPLVDPQARPEERAACRNALMRIAQKAGPHIAKGKGISGQAYSMLANAFSKLLGDPQAKPEERNTCCDMLARIARSIIPLSERSGFFNIQAYANLVNAFSKPLGDSQATSEGKRACRDALMCIAKKIILINIEQGSDFHAQHYANLANGFSKLLGDPQATQEEMRTCRRALMHIARNIVPRIEQGGNFNVRDYANLTNAFCKLFDDVQTTPEEKRACRNALARIAQKIASQIQQDSSFHVQESSNLANAFCKLLGDPQATLEEREACRHVLMQIAKKVAHGIERGDSFDTHSYTSLANAFSKPLGDPQARPEERNACRDALARIAQKIALDLEQGSNFNTQQYANLANACCKPLDDPQATPEEKRACRNALTGIAQKIASQTEQDKDFSSQEYSNLANAFSKSFGDTQATQEEKRACRNALVYIAKCIAPRIELGEGFNEQHCANLANAFSKPLGDLHATPAEKHACRDVLMRIAQKIASDIEQGGGFAALEYSSLANAFSKVFADPHATPEEMHACRNALARIAKKIAFDIEPGNDFTAQAHANLANALSKPFGDPQATQEERYACRHALMQIAEKIPHGIEQDRHYNAQHYANLANAFSKLFGDLQSGSEEKDACCHALACIAEKIASDLKQGSDYNAQQSSILTNAFSKPLGDPQATPEVKRACRHALTRMAQKIALGIQQGGDFNGQQYANLANGLCKLLDDQQARPEERAACRDALVCIAKKILPGIEQGCDFNEQQYANLANAFCKLTGYQQEATDGVDVHCLQALGAIAAQMSSERIAVMSIGHIGMLSHAFGRTLTANMPESDSSAKSMKKALRHFAAHLVQRPELLAPDNLRASIMIAKALGQAGLLGELSSLVKPWLDSIATGVGNNGLRENNLETLGNLCQALQPFLVIAGLREHRSAALQLLVTQLQPVIARKLARHLVDPQQAATDQDDACDTRQFALTVYQILNLYMAAVLQWSKKNIQGVPRPELKAQQAALTTWIGEVYEQTSSLIDADVSSASWNTIAQIEAEIKGDPTTMIDDFLQRRLDKIAAQVQPSSFDAIGVLDRLNHPPAMPAAHSGVGTITYHKFNGAPMVKDGVPQREERYTLWHRLTQGKVALRYVALPGHLSHFMLGRFIYIDGAPHRIDLFGGSKMKKPTQRVSQLFQAVEGTPDNGHLVAVPVGETLGGSDFEKLFSRLLPSEEAFFYAQRALMASPPENIAGLGPTDHVLEGRFEIGILPDRAPGQMHPFRIGNTRLRPHDGTGFIKASLAEKMGWYPKAQAQQIKPYGGDIPRANLPSQALQHYRRDDKAAAELVETLVQRLQSGEALDKEDIFRGATSALVRGHIAVAVPTDEKLVLPSAKSREFDAAPGGLLIGRSPYDQANLRPIPLDQVGTAKSGDETAQFLDRTWAMQYSFVGLEKQGGRQQDDPNLMFAKGILMVVPDAQWPKAYQSTSMVISSEDPKAESSWKERKQRATSEQRRTFQGALVTTEVFAPGSLIGMPIAEQKKLEGDFDGDPLLILPPRLKEFHRLVSEHEQQKTLQLATKPKDKRSFKPVKTHTSAFNEDGSYRFGRAMHIKAGKLNVLPEFVSLQMGYLAQPDEVRRQLDEAIVFSVYEGWGRQLEQEVEALLDDPASNRERISRVCAMLEREYAQATHPATRQACRVLRQELRQMAAASHIRLAPSALDAITEEGALKKMLPEWTKAAAAANTPQARIATLCTYMPARLLDKQTSPSYIEGNAQATVQQLFTEGIKKGTDAFKAPRAVFEYEVAAKRLRNIYSRMEVPGNVAYDKSLARKLAAGTFVAEEAVQSLQDNPTLAAEVASNSIALLNEGEHFAQFASPSQSGSAEEKAFWAGVGQLRQHWQTTSSFAVFDLPADRSTGIASRYAALTNKLGEDARALEKHITPLLAQTIPPGLGVEAAPQDRIKSAISTAQKITRLVRENGGTSEQAAFRVKDALRYVFVINDEAQFSRDAEEVLKALERHPDLERQTLHNTFTSGAIYKGINVTYRHSKSGMQFELQLHTAASFHAKKRNHAAYRKEMEEGIAEEERMALRASQQEISDLVPLPTGVERIGKISHEASSSALASVSSEMEEGWETVPARKKSGARGGGRNEVWDQRLGPRQGKARDFRAGRGGRSAARR